LPEPRTRKLRQCDHVARDHQRRGGEGLHAVQNLFRIERFVGREHHELFALLRIGHRDDGVLAFGQSLLQLRLHQRERDHLARDLREALGAAQDGDEPVKSSTFTMSPVSYQPSGGASITPGLSARR
jgi:hypothetical protein